MEFKYLAMILTNQNAMHGEIKSKLNVGNACNLFGEEFLSSRLISMNLKVTYNYNFV
jgi:hypothetical protein